MPLDVNVETDESGRSIVTVLGEVDIATVDELAKALGALNGQSEVIVDLTRTEFMDSSGLRLIVEANEQSEAAGQLFRIAVSGGPIGRLLDVTGLRDQLQVYESVEEATSA